MSLAKQYAKYNLSKGKNLCSEVACMNTCIEWKTQKEGVALSPLSWERTKSPEYPSRFALKD